MNRRSFLMSLVALVSPSLPILAISPSVTLAKLRAAKARLLESQDDYFAIIHPSEWVSILEFEARSAWQDRWRAYRMARRSGGQEKTPHQIIADWTPRPLPLNGELGRFESVRLIASRYIA